MLSHDDDDDDDDEDDDEAQRTNTTLFDVLLTLISIRVDKSITML